MNLHSCPSRLPGRFGGILRSFLVLGLLVTFVSAGGYAPQRSQAAPQTDCQLTWSAVKHPTYPQDYNVFYDVTAISAEDIWAIGNHTTQAGDTDLLAEHWDGHTWKVVKSSIGTQMSDFFTAVDAVATNDVWVAGMRTPNALVQHWNGTEWSEIPTPKVGISGNALLAIKAVTADDVWAAGEYFADNGILPLLLHWDGSLWSVVHSSIPPRVENRINGLAAITANDVWAVGEYRADSYSEPSQTLILHYDGNSWQEVPSPNTGSGSNFLTSVAAISANDIWAVGQENSQGPFRGLILHWDGVSWQVDSSADSFMENKWLSGISAIASNDIWAVGTSSTLEASSAYTLHWDGTAWSEGIIPEGGNAANNHGVVSIAHGDVWAVGHEFAGEIDSWLEHYGPPIPKPTLLSPVKNGTVNRKKARLDWRDAACATSYQVIVRQNSKNGATVDSQMNLAVSQYKTVALARGKKYFWSVRGCDADGCGFWSPWRPFRMSP